MNTKATYSGAITLADGTIAYCGAEGCQVWCDGGAEVSVKFAGWEMVSFIDGDKVLSTKILRSPARIMGGDSAFAKSLNERAYKRNGKVIELVEAAALAKVLEIGRANWPEVFDAYKGAA